MSKDSLTHFFRSKLFAGIIAGVGITLIAVFIFEVGVTIGYHEATFSEGWGANYAKNFGGPSNDMGLPDAHLPQPNGTFGKIISVSSTTPAGTTIVIDNTSKPEQKVLVTSDTTIRDHENTDTASSLTVGAYAVVVGTPDDQGEIEAKLIRLVPAPTGTNTSPNGNQ
jgi:Domain of unknown function (DUF5666)